MHALKEAQVERQFFLGNPPMGSQPRAQQRPEPLGGVDMALVKAVAVVIAGVFAPAVAHRPMVEAPLGQAGVNVVFIGIYPGSRRDEPLDQRPDRGLPDVLQHPDHHRAAPLDHPENRRLFAFQGAAPACPLQPAPPAPTTLFLTASGGPL